MVTFPPCKINLGLQVLGRRPDGYHDISTCFYPVPWTDVLEIIPAGKWEFHQTGIEIPGPSDNNLCARGYHLFETAFHLPPVQMHLHKIIPTGAGLGGGSSNAAYTLRMLNSIFELKLSQEQLMSYALALGSDCPFFIQEKPMLGSGRGEILHPVNTDLKDKYLVILVPGIHVSTAEAYQEIVPGTYSEHVRERMLKPLSSWKTGLENDFEASVFKRHPSLQSMKAQLYSDGAVYASMSGSGSSVFGIFEKEVEEDLFKGVLHWSGWL